MLKAHDHGAQLGGVSHDKFEDFDLWLWLSVHAWFLKLVSVLLQGFVGGERCCAQVARACQLVTKRVLAITHTDHYERACWRL